MRKFKENAKLKVRKWGSLHSKLLGTKINDVQGWRAGVGRTEKKWEFSHLDLSFFFFFFLHSLSDRCSDVNIIQESSHLFPSSNVVSLLRNLQLTPNSYLQNGCPLNAYAESVLNGCHDKYVNLNEFAASANKRGARLEIRVRIVFGNVCHYSVQKLSLFRNSEDIQNNFIICFLRLWNMAPCFEDGT
jgi:hypothetical protein